MPLARRPALQLAYPRIRGRSDWAASRGRGQWAAARHGTANRPPKNANPRLSHADTASRHWREMSIGVAPAVVSVFLASGAALL